MRPAMATVPGRETSICSRGLLGPLMNVILFCAEPYGCDDYVDHQPADAVGVDETCSRRSGVLREVGIMRSLRTISYGVALTLMFGATAQSQSADKRYLILLIGPTGSGKTTQAEFLKKRFGIPTIAVDELIQANPAALTKHRTAGITPGPPQLNPAIDELVAEKVTGLDLTKGLALDGYPASKDQADHLAALARQLNLPSPIVIQIDLPDEIARQRLRKRQRADDHLTWWRSA